MCKWLCCAQCIGELGQVNVHSGGKSKRMKLKILTISSKKRGCVDFIKCIDQIFNGGPVSAASMNFGWPDTVTWCPPGSMLKQ